ncbi:hypothetical protein KFE25_001793 [Diacronema lutheri]|uniref:CUE domain-containing protein n=2 Tax=Diacronema lutheri TaxID=2081491 RepID=A0A8J5XH96_DIALT|nr:hypothetical protein KFE25_001793 [Diacronema lutheri]
MEGDLLGNEAPGLPPPPPPPADLADTDPVGHLAAMFPMLERSVVEMVFTDMAGSDVERAIEALLQITDDSVDTAEAASAEQAGSDELLALQMLQQMMNEEDMAKADADKVFRRIHEDVEKKAAFKNTPKGVREAFVRNLEKMKMRAAGKKGGSSTREYKQQYGALLDEEDDPQMKV